MRVLRGLKVWLILAVLALSIWAPPRTARGEPRGARRTRRETNASRGSHFTDPF
jgi:hypothetical protein